MESYIRSYNIVLPLHNDINYEAKKKKIHVHI